MNSKIFPILYDISSTGKQKMWKVEARDNKVITTHGYVDGKLQEDITEVEIKNVGKSNQTTPWEQAIAEAQSKWNKKRDKGYLESNEKKTSKVILPMLAENYSKRSHDIVFPAFVQPKLNGIRLVAYDGLYQSRLGKFWTSLSHLDSDIEKLNKQLALPLDGELFIPGLNLQDIGALVKKERIDEEIEGYKTEDLEYWIFDFIDTNTNFSNRISILMDAFVNAGAVRDKNYLLKLGKLVYVPTYNAVSDERINFYHKMFVSDGHEGTIVRNDVQYVTTHRTKHLQKKKDTLDAEYKVVGGKDGVGRDAGCVIFRCVTDTGIEFDAKPTGTVKQRKRWFKDINKIINSMVTIKYQELSNLGVPMFGRVISVRDYE